MRSADQDAQNGSRPGDSALCAYIAVYFATRTRRGTLWIIAANAAFFAALLAVMFYLRWTAEAWPTPFHFASLIMVAALTMLAVSGSATLEIAARAAKFDDPEPAVRWVAVGIASWLTFLFLEIVEWVRLIFLLELGPHTAFGGTYLVLMGAHWLAALACVCWMTYVANDTRRRDIVAVALYSHFLNLLWIVLVITLYLTNFSLGEI
jgi:heme/copper-type cytochrome/quinol oxidase subunit 3